MGSGGGGGGGGGGSGGVRSKGEENAQLMREKN